MAIAEPPAADARSRTRGARVRVWMLGESAAAVRGGVAADPRAVIAIALGLGAAVAYAAFADGAIALPMEARLQVAIAALALFALAALLFAPPLRIAAGRLGWAGVVLLAVLTIYTGLSFAWSIAPDGTWGGFNRVLAYLLVTLVALLVGSTLARSLERAALGFLVIATAVALYALAGKAIPGVHVGPVDFDHTQFFSRLRAPLAYWNALALFCVLAVPIALRAAADRRRAALAAAVLLLVTIGLTYSRGGVSSLLVAVALLLAVGPERLSTAAAAGAALLGAAPALAVGFTRDDLTTDAVPVAERTGDGLLFLAALVAGVVLALVIDRLVVSRTDRVELPRRRAFALAGAAAVVAVVLAVAGLAASPRGVTGTISHGFDNFRSVKFERQNDPARILQTNSGNRWVWWSEAAGAWSDRPLAGWGAGSFPLLHRRYRHNALEVLQPHSVPLQFLAELGLTGAALALAALGLLTAAGARRFLAGARANRTGIPTGREQRYAAALLAGVAAWLVHMWFDWDWDVPGVALPLFAFLGLLAARPRGTPGRAFAPARSAPVGARVAALALGAALLAAVAISAALPSLARDHTQRATAALAASDFGEAVRQADIARRLDPVAVDALLLEARAAGRRGQFKLASEVLTEAVHRQPDNPNVWLGVARLELARGDIPAMRAAARRMLVLDPVAPVGTYFFLLNDLGVRSATATGTPLTPEGDAPLRTRSEARAMGFLRRGDDEPGGRRFQMHQRLASIGDDFWIEDENGDRVYKVDGKAMRVRETLILEDRNGNEVAKIQEKKLSVRDKMTVERGDRKVATIHKALVGIRDRFEIEIENGEDLKARGNIVDHEYEIKRDGDTIATVSKKWFRIRDTYGIEIAAGEDTPLLLAVTVAIDQLGRGRD